MMTAPPYIDGATLMSLVSWNTAVLALESALARGVGDHTPRTAVPAAGGHLLLMPAANATAVGVKLAAVAPDNPAAGLPRIQAVYVLFDADTLTPRAFVDGTTLTTLRTPALSALAVRELAVEDAGLLVVFGTGPQAWGHVHAVSAVRKLREVSVVGRRHDRTAAFVGQLRAEGVNAVVGAPQDVASADIVVCATSARGPVFDGRLLAGHACVAAVGSHEPDARELDDAVFARASRVVVEDAPTALREAGDVVMAVAAGALRADRLVTVADLAALPPAEGIGVFKGVGMAWQDLAVAEAAHDAWLASRG
ncbi:ornithine cyclodeaminase family protein [Streptantibioticus silvisoli]|uniref:Ornithine cyclodeaminase family protein n=1 Tax=Streptantibioticus silvisoli TaxID=2705255 RepID=A0ABT6W940_9ACTN|nr:ornithine cyclodeaminase family protein [Streptantibioticus silvisoli]MDI5966452.1 ornithine cyclodeaminase family protein [Streptantibioticus silvisoli]